MKILAVLTRCILIVLLLFITLQANPTRIRGGYNGWNTGIAFEGIEMMVWSWLRWGEVVFGVGFVHLCKLLRCYGVYFNTIYIANTGGDVYNACGALDREN